MNSLNIGNIRPSKENGFTGLVDERDLRPMFLNVVSGITLLIVMDMVLSHVDI